MQLNLPENANGSSLVDKPCREKGQVQLSCIHAIARASRFPWLLRFTSFERFSGKMNQSFSSVLE
jgi:hypothetical protein